MPFKNKSDEDWKSQLSDESYYVTRQSGTERPFTGKYWNFKEKGQYNCICCDTPLFESDTKFDSGCGWPSFFLPKDKETISEVPDHSHGMTRIEVKCKQCDAHKCRRRQVPKITEQDHNKIVHLHLRISRCY